MTDFAALRRVMVDGQVRTADVTDPRLIDAMLTVPREYFVPARKADLAYLDLDASVDDGVSGGGRCLLKPMVLAKLIQAAMVMPGERVLDVGCASGYSSAILACLCAQVIAIEEDAGLARRAAAAFSAAGIGNVTLMTGTLEQGAATDAPYDVIVLEGATEIEPQRLFDQLKDNGRLVCVFGRGPGGKAMLYRRTGREVSGRTIFDATAPLLPGFAASPAFVF